MNGGSVAQGGAETWQPALGALLAEDGVFFRVWAPDCRQVEAVVFADLPGPVRQPLTREVGGYWSGLVRGAGAGARYMYRLDGRLDRPDPASRSQPDGVHGPSEVVDPAFPWTDAGWRGLAR
jgi:maltooligosyltrehalose trehalohydrolase